MKLKLKAVALFSLALRIDHYFLFDIDRGILVDTISYGDFSISMIPPSHWLCHWREQFSTFTALSFLSREHERY